MPCVYTSANVQNNRIYPRYCIGYRIALVSFSQFLSPSPQNFPLHHNAIYKIKTSQKLSTCKFSKPVQNSENICTQKNGLYE